MQQVSKSICERISRYMYIHCKLDACKTCTVKSRSVYTVTKFSCMYLILASRVICCILVLMDNLLWDR